MSKCDVCGKELKKEHHLYGYTLCSKHMHQLFDTGHFLDDCSRTQKDLNEFTTQGDVAIFDLYDRHGYKNGEFIIDIEDIEKVRYHKWRENHSYVVTGLPYIKNSCKRIANIILDIDPDGHNFIIDHINGNPKDNRKCNLRITTQGKNVLNRKSEGVWWRNDRNKWIGEIRYEDKRYSRQFATKIEALYWRYLMECKLFKEYRRIDESENDKLKLFKTIPQEQRMIIENSIQSA